LIIYIIPLLGQEIKLFFKKFVNNEGTNQGDRSENIKEEIPLSMAV